ncbi:MAG: hypothetical protein OEY20_13925 [Gemmatimonadota bacterium]|nr:hypothetical protein [Gemmatimonadota bacterium]MDH4350382.1 hypothetical protein [Gemmatimonadota bacterium]MDH5198336.1 hypothetical protein [Gemmatimonadota bacterium]
MPSLLRRVARPDRFRVSLTDAGGGLALPLASRQTWIIGLGIGVASLVVASIAWQQLSSMRHPRGDAFFDLVIRLLRWSWVVGLWVAALGLFLLMIALLFYREFARVADNRLIHVARFGPIRAVMEYDLANVRNLRAEGTGGEGARIRFDYGHRDRGLGAELPLAEAEARVKMIQAAIDGMATRRASQAAAAAPRPTPRP